MQSVFDELYENSLAKCEFKNLISIITAEENIRLAYRNLKKNAGSRTPGTDGKTIADLAKMSEPELIGFVQQKFNWYQPQSVRRKEIPKSNGKTRPLGIPTIMDRLIQQCVLQIHKNLECVDMSILHSLMKNPITSATVEYNDNRISLYVAQQGKCAITKKQLSLEEIHCHHKKPKSLGGGDNYANLIILHERIHRLIHATQKGTISAIMQTVQLNKQQLDKLNKLRKLAGTEAITLGQQNTCC